MTNREYLKIQIDALPERALEKVGEFIAFQRFALGMYDDDTEYLLSVPGMAEKSLKG